MISIGYLCSLVFIIAKVRDGLLWLLAIPIYSKALTTKPNAFYVSYCIAGVYELAYLPKISISKTEQHFYLINGDISVNANFMVIK